MESYEHFEDVSLSSQTVFILIQQQAEVMQANLAKRTP
jgi:hypothetical protein